MRQEEKCLTKQTISNGQTDYFIRNINPSDIDVPPEYLVEVFAYGLDTPISMVFTEDGDMLIGESGVTSGNGKVVRLRNNQLEIIADGFNPPLTGINYLNGDIYVSHRGKITIIRPDGTKVDVISGLPSFGDHHNNQVIFGSDEKMYFGQGTATNSGVVGLDNHWLSEHPFFHDFAGSRITLNGCNFVTENIFTEANVYAYTGAFSSFGEPNLEILEQVRGHTKASGSILRSNLDGSGLELIAWGLRNPFRLKFDRFNRLFTTNHGADVRGSRPIANCPDEFQLITPGTWYGWPDYSGGKPVTLPEFKPQGGPNLTLLLANPPSVPPIPFAVFTPHSAIMGFDFNYNPYFGIYGDAYIAEFGSEAPETTGGQPLPNVGHRISKINMKNGSVTNFASNKSGVAASETGEGGFERPIDVVFGPDGAMYVLDFGVTKSEDEHDYQPNSGVIWKISKIQE